MAEKKYIIRYAFGYRTEWNYSFGIKGGSTRSGNLRDDRLVIKITLTEARKYIKRIVQLRQKNNGGVVTEIQILDAETNEIMDNEEKEISRFELMEID